MITRNYHSHYYKVEHWFIFSTEDLGKEVAESLNKSGMIGQVVFVKCDISNEDDVKVIL